MTGISGNNSAPRHLSAQHSSELVYADEFDPSVTTYNLVCSVDIGLAGFVKRIIAYYL